MKLNHPYYVEPRTEQAHISLEGIWDYGYTEKEVNVPEEQLFLYHAHIPDSTYWNLYESGILPHPYQGLNSKSYSWVDEKVWYYRKEFYVDAELSDSQAVLCFEGIAYYSRIWLNGNLLGEHEGMFGGPFILITENVKYGSKNEVVVEVKACNFGKKKEYHGRNLHGKNREIVPWNIARDSDTSNGDLIVLGLWRPVRIEFLSSFHLARPYLITTEIEEKTARLRLETEIIGPELNEFHSFYGIFDEDPIYSFAYSEGIKQVYRDISAKIHIHIEEKKSGTAIYDSDNPVQLLDYSKSIRAEAYPESQFFEKEFELLNPKLWWPHDMGEAFLYTVVLTLWVNDKICDEITFEYGVRTIRTIRSVGPRVRERWDQFQFVINNRKIFLKGVNWMPQDALYREREKEYRWSLDLIKNAGIHMIRVWSGGGMPESDIFYRLCDEMGIMVWQDHFIANTSHTEGWPQDVLEAQECVNLYRIRNHPSLAVHCGGNEFNAYSAGNAASMFVIERSIHTLDPTRIFYYTTPDKGSAHIYRDMEPIWYRHLYKDLPFVAETGIHSFPNFKALKKCICERECTDKLPELTTEEFQKKFPELLNHFTEYVPERVPRMLARASQISDLKEIDLKGLAEATQIASCEYYEILIQALRENYPITTGVMPWVFKRTWTTVGIQLVDGTGEPIAPYYYLKNAYQCVEAHLELSQITVAPKEKLRIPIRVCNEYGKSLEDYDISVKIWAPDMNILYKCSIPAEDADGKNVEWETGADWKNCYFFFTVDLNQSGQLVARQVYWPKCLKMMEDEEVRNAFRKKPQENLRLGNGPWLKEQISAAKGTILWAEGTCIYRDGQRIKANIKIKNAGETAAFPVILEFHENGTRGMMQDNYFWMEAGEERTLWAEADISDEISDKITLPVSSWNAEPQYLFFSV